MSVAMSRRQRVLWWVSMPICALVAVVSSRYLLGMGLRPPLIETNEFRRPFLVIHVLGSVIALMIGCFQFLPKLRRPASSLHQLTGRVYVIGCLVGGIAGVPLALGASTGTISTVGFGMLALAWIFVTVQGWRCAVERRFAAHRAWMIRSFALTLAAVTLRVYLILLDFLPVSFEDGYRAISFLCWVPNWIVAEIVLYRHCEHASSPAYQEPAS
ncbi:DUF2306 domain-containing protein [Ensifer canadensis]